MDVGSEILALYPGGRGNPKIDRDPRIDPRDGDLLFYPSIELFVLVLGRVYGGNLVVYQILDGQQERIETLDGFRFVFEHCVPGPVVDFGQGFGPAQVSVDGVDYKVFRCQPSKGTWSWAEVAVDGVRPDGSRNRKIVYGNVCVNPERLSQWDVWGDRKATWSTREMR